MKKNTLFLPLFVLLGSAGAFLLRMLFFRTGLEPGTGLPIPDNPYSGAFLILLVGLALLFALLIRSVPQDQEPLPFGRLFTTRSAALLALLVSSVFLLLLSGILEIAGALRVGAARVGLFGGLLTMIAAGSILPVIPACRKHRDHRHDDKPPYSGRILILPVCCMVVRLVLVYRADSVNPSISVYFVEILAMAFLTLAIYRLSSFAFGVGRTRRFLFYASLTVVLCFATLAEGHPLPGMLFYLGSALTLISFCLLRLNAISKGETST